MNTWVHQSLAFGYTSVLPWHAFCHIPAESIQSALQAIIKTSSASLWQAYLTWSECLPVKSNYNFEFNTNKQTFKMFQETSKNSEQKLNLWWWHGKLQSLPFQQIRVCCVITDKIWQCHKLTTTNVIITTHSCDPTQQSSTDNMSSKEHIKKELHDTYLTDCYTLYHKATNRKKVH